MKAAKELLSKDLNAKSVALEATKKDFSENRKMFDKKVATLELELVKFSEFKEEKKADDKMRKKTEKKAKQKLKKEQLARGISDEEHIVKDVDVAEKVLDNNDEPPTDKEAKH